MSNHPELLATVDVVSFMFRDSKLNVVLWLRDREPFNNCLALPGAIINGMSADNDMQDTVDRVFSSRLGVKPSYIEQVCTVGNNTRDHRGWSISTVYMALVPDTDEAFSGVVDACKIIPVDSIENGSVELPFDHKELVLKAKERLASKALYSSMPLMLLDSNGFTVNELIEAYNSIITPSVKPITLRKRIEFLESQGHVGEAGKTSSGKGRPQKIYTHDGRIHYFDRSILGS